MKMRSRRSISFSVILLLVLVLSAGAVWGSDTGIRGSKHDFSGMSWSGGQVCAVCHVPHGANSDVSAAPLWSHSITTQTYIPYQSLTLNAVVGQPDGVSKLCLSCHDGTIALDAFSGSTGTGLNWIKDKIGPNLNSDGHWGHPVSFVYDSALSEASGKLNDPATTPSSLGGTVQQDLLFKGKVQCSSCHDVHNKQGFGKLLRVKDEGDLLCLQCHK